MKRSIVIVIAAIFVLSLALSAVYAVGSCCGKGPKAAQNGQVCDMSQKQACSQMGWWNRVEPKTAEQKAFVNQAKSLHQQIKAKHVELAKLKTDKAPAGKISAKDKEIAALKTSMKNLMTKNSELRKQMGVTGECKMMGADCKQCCVDCPKDCCVNGCANCPKDCCKDGCKAGCTAKVNETQAAKTCGACPKTK